METPNVNLLEDARFVSFCRTVIAEIVESRRGKKNLLRTPLETLNDEGKLTPDWLRNEYRLLSLKQSTEPKSVRDYIKAVVETAMYNLAKFDQQQADKLANQAKADGNNKLTRKPRQKKIS